MKTTDICDEHEEKVKVGNISNFKHFGYKKSFYGKIITVKCFEDNSFVRKAIERDGTGCVLIVDGGASLNCALLGDINATLAVDNNWQGIVINGAIRHSHELGKINLGVLALGTCPKKSIKKDIGHFIEIVNFAGIDFINDQYVYVDEDGILVSKDSLC